MWAVQQTSAEGLRGGAMWPRTLIHLQCAGCTAAQAWKVLKKKREFQCING